MARDAAAGSLVVATGTTGTAGATSTAGVLGTRPPRALKPLKARCAAECERLEQLPNIGPSIAADLRGIGIDVPAQLVGTDPLALYRRLCEATGRRHDPCVLDTFMAAVAFMDGAEPRPWWTFTAERKRRHGAL